MGVAKQMRFAAEYVKDYNATAAYKRAGYKDTAAAEHNASRVMGYDKVKAEIDRLQRELAKNSTLSVEKVLETLEYGLQLAIAENDLKAIAKFAELQGKYLAMYTDKHITEQSAEEKELSELERNENKRMARLMLIDARTGTRIDQDGQADVKAG